MSHIKFFANFMSTHQKTRFPKIIMKSRDLLMQSSCIKREYWLKYNSTVGVPNLCQQSTIPKIISFWENLIVNIKIK